MAKTKGKYIPGSYSFKHDTPVEKFAFMVYGTYMETTAVSDGQARHAIKSRYNKENRRAMSAWVEMTPTAVRGEAVAVTTKVSPKIETEKCLEPEVGIQYLFDLLAQK